MSAPAPSPFPRQFLFEAFHTLREDLPVEVIDILVERTISEVLAFPAPLPAEAYLP